MLQDQQVLECFSLLHAQIDVKLKTESFKAVVFIWGRIAFGSFAGAGGEFGAEGFPSVCFFFFSWDNENNHMEFNWEMLKIVKRRELEFKTWRFGSCPSSLVTAWEQTVCLHFNTWPFVTPWLPSAASYSSFKLCAKHGVIRSRRKWHKSRWMSESERQCWASSREQQEGPNVMRGRRGQSEQ